MTCPPPPPPSEADEQHQGASIPNEDQTDAPTIAASKAEEGNETDDDDTSQLVRHSKPIRLGPGGIPLAPWEAEHQPTYNAELTATALEALSIDHDVATFLADEWDLTPDELQWMAVLETSMLAKYAEDRGRADFDQEVIRENYDNDEKETQRRAKEDQEFYKSLGEDWYEAGWFDSEEDDEDVEGEENAEVDSEDAGECP